MLSLKKNACLKQRRWNMTNYILNYFLVSVFVFCGYGLYFRILFQFCGLILYFFVGVAGLLCLFPFWDLCFCFLVVFFCFGFPFCLMCFCFGFVLFYFCCCCCRLVVFLFLSVTLYIWWSSAFKSNHWRTLQNSVENFFTEIKSSR